MPISASARLWGRASSRNALGALSPERPFVPILIRSAGHLGALGSHLFEVAEYGKVAFLSQSPSR